jgi:MFS family permease
MRVPVFLTLLSERTTRRVAVAATVSSLGDWVNYGAVIALITFGDHDGATELALLALVMVIPTVVLSPLAGALADRVPLRRTMVACDLARVVVVATFVLAPDLWILFVLIALREVFSTLFTPAQQAYVALGVPPEDQVGVISLNQTGIQLSKIVGPGLGGLLYAIAGSHVAFGVDAASFAVSALFLARLPGIVPAPPSLVPLPVEVTEGQEPSEEQEPSPPSGLLSQIREGLGFVRTTPVLRTVITAFTLSMFVIVAYDTLSPLALRSLGFGAGSYGLVVGAVGAGAVVGSLALGQFGGRLPPFLVFAGADALGGLCVAGLGAGVLWSTGLPTGLWVAVALVLGGASSGIIVAFPVILQGATPAPLMGRVMATAQGVSTAPQLLAPLVGAAVAAGTGVGGVLAICGAVLAAIGIGLALGPHLRWTHLDPEGPAGRIEAAGASDDGTVTVYPPLPDESTVSRFALSASQQDVWDHLSAEERSVLTHLGHRLREAEDDVMAHGDTAGGLLF